MALVGGKFVPTFPNATYLVPRADYGYFHPGNAANMRPPETEDERRRFTGIRLVFEDSITPVERALRTVLVEIPPRRTCRPGPDTEVRARAGGRMVAA